MWHRHPQLMSVVTGINGLIGALLWLPVSETISAHLFSVGIATCCQHLTERLDGAEPILASFVLRAEHWLWIDRLLAVSFAWHARHYILTPDLSSFEILLIVVGIASLLLCDCGVVTDALAYSAIHSVWHCCVFAFIMLRGVRQMH